MLPGKVNSVPVEISSLAFVQTMEAAGRASEEHSRVPIFKIYIWWGILVVFMVNGHASPRFLLQAPQTLHLIPLPEGRLQQLQFGQSFSSACSTEAITYIPP